MNLWYFLSLDALKSESSFWSILQCILDNPIVFKMKELLTFILECPIFSVSEKKQNS